jgi:hypothetical protein
VTPHRTALSAPPFESGAVIPNPADSSRPGFRFDV